MRSSFTWRHLCGLVVVLAAFAFLHYGGGVTNGQPLRSDHTKTWAFAKVPHRAPTDLERRLGKAASFVARRPVQVRCQHLSNGKLVEPGGVVEFNGSSPADYTRIRPDVCTELMQFMQTPAGAFACLSHVECSAAIVPSANALTVLAHESMHLRGIKNEATAQCYAMQELPQLAEEFGADEPDSRALAVIEFAVGYPRMPMAYRSPDCRAGGTLDLHPGDGWPD